MKFLKNLFSPPKEDNPLDDLTSYESIKEVAEREKLAATLKREPWVKVINIDTTDIGNPEMEIDFNTYFIDDLKKAGYSGKTDEEVFELWFNDILRGTLGE